MKNEIELQLKWSTVPEKNEQENENVHPKPVRRLEEYFDFLEEVKTDIPDSVSVTLYAERFELL